MVVACALPLGSVNCAVHTVDREATEGGHTRDALLYVMRCGAVHRASNPQRSCGARQRDLQQRGRSHALHI